MVSDDDDVQELNAQTTHQQSAFGGASNSGIPRVPRKDGSDFFIPGVTLPPLGEGILQEGRSIGTGSLANVFGYHIGRVTSYSSKLLYLPSLVNSFDPFSSPFQANNNFYTVLHIAQEGSASWLFTAALENANNDLQELRAMNEEALAQVKKANKESEGLKAALEEAHRAMELEQKAREEARNLLSSSLGAGRRPSRSSRSSSLSWMSRRLSSLQLFNSTRSPRSRSLSWRKRRRT